MHGGAGMRPPSGCYRCSTCSVNYPPLKAHATCEVCDGDTDHLQNTDYDPNWEDAVRFARLNPSSAATRGDPRCYRIQQYLDMGFNLGQAEKLADSKWGRYQHPLYPPIVKRALKGCDHLVAFDLFATVLDSQ